MMQRMFNPAVPPRLSTKGQRMTKEQQQMQHQLALQQWQQQQQQQKQQKQQQSQAPQKQQNSKKTISFRHCSFFTEQLTAFEVWLDYASKDKKPPEQLPIVLQVLLVRITIIVFELLLCLAMVVVVFLPWLLLFFDHGCC
jgi:Flp pilus assembly protein TadB